MAANEQAKLDELASRARLAEAEANNERQAHVSRAQKDIENTLSPEVIQLTLAQKLPELAQAFRQNMGQVHVTAVGGANPFGFVAAAVEGVLGLARSAGLELPTKNPVERPSR